MQHNWLIERENDCLLLMKNGDQRTRELAAGVLAQVRARRFITRPQVKALACALGHIHLDGLLTAEQKEILQELEDFRPRY